MAWPGLLLDAGHQAADFRRRLGRPLGQLPDLVRHHREAAARLAGPRRLDGGVQRQQVGLIGDFLDELDDAADVPGPPGQALDAFARRADALDHGMQVGRDVLEGDPVGIGLGGGGEGRGRILAQLAGQAGKGQADAGQRFAEAGDVAHHAVQQRLASDLLLPLCLGLGEALLGSAQLPLQCVRARLQPGVFRQGRRQCLSCLCSKHAASHCMTRSNVEQFTREWRRPFDFHQAVRLC